MGGLENLIKLKVNLKNWSWSVEPKFVLDENDAKGLIEEIEAIEIKDNEFREMGKFIYESLKD